MNQELKGEVSMIATAALIAIGIAAVMGFIKFLPKGGCEGSCNQGRTKCNCKKFE